MNSSTLFMQTISYSLVYSLVLGLSFLLIARINPEMWLNDYPPDIKEKFGSMSEKANRLRIILGIPVIVFMLGFPFFVIVQFAQATSLTFWQVFGSLFFIYTFFNLFDMIVMDWLIFCTITPRRFVIPGSERHPAYKDYFFHFRGFLIGTFFSAVMGLIAAGIVTIFG